MGDTNIHNQGGGAFERLTQAAQTAGTGATGIGKGIKTAVSEGWSRVVSSPPSAKFNSLIETVTTLFKSLVSAFKQNAEKSEPSNTRETTMRATVILRGDPIYTQEEATLFFSALPPMPQTSIVRSTDAERQQSIARAMDNQRELSVREQPPPRGQSEAAAQAQQKRETFDAELDAMMPDVDIPEMSPEELLGDIDRAEVGSLNIDDMESLITSLEGGTQKSPVNLDEDAVPTSRSNTLLSGMPPTEAEEDFDTLLKRIAEEVEEPKPQSPSKFPDATAPSEGPGSAPPKAKPPEQ